MGSSQSSESDIGCNAADEDRLPGSMNQIDNDQVSRVAPIDRSTNVPAPQTYTCRLWLSQEFYEDPWNILSFDQRPVSGLGQHLERFTISNSSLTVGLSSSNDCTREDSLAAHNAYSDENTSVWCREALDYVCNDRANPASRPMDSRIRNSGILRDASRDNILPTFHRPPRDAGQAASTSLCFRESGDGKIFKNTAPRPYAITQDPSKYGSEQPATVITNKKAPLQDTVQNATLMHSRTSIHDPENSVPPTRRSQPSLICHLYDLDSIKTEAGNINLGKAIRTSSNGARALSFQNIMHEFNDTLIAECEMKFRACAGSHPASRGSVAHFGTDKAGKRRKRLDRRHRSNGDGNGKGEDSLINGSKSRTEPLLACPFHKFNREKYCVKAGIKYRTCCRPGFISIARLNHAIRQHLRRVHKASYQCLTCDITVSHVELLAQHPHQEEQGPDRTAQTEGIDDIKMKKIMEIKNPAWQEIYLILFPGSDVPSQYIDDEESCGHQEIPQSMTSPTIDDFVAYITTVAPLYWTPLLNEIVTSGRLALTTDIQALLQDAFRKGVLNAASRFPDAQDVASGMSTFPQPAASRLGQSNIAHDESSTALPPTAIPTRDLSPFQVYESSSPSVNTTKAADNNVQDSGYASNTFSCYCECHCVIGSSSQSTYESTECELCAANHAMHKRERSNIEDVDDVDFEAFLRDTDEQEMEGNHLESNPAPSWAVAASQSAA